MNTTFYATIRDARGNTLFEDFEVDLELNVDASQIKYGCDPDVTLKRIFLPLGKDKFLNMELPDADGGCELNRLIAKQIREAAETEIDKRGTIYIDAMDDEGLVFVTRGGTDPDAHWRRTA